MGFLKNKKRYIVMLIVSIIVLLLMIVLACTIGAAQISFINALKILFSKVPFIGGLMSLHSVNPTDELIVLGVRLPRILLSCITGIGLSIIGGVLQSLFRNPMAEPGVLGISSGAALGASIAIMLGLSQYIFGIGIIVLFAFFGAILTIVIVYRIALTNGRVSPVTLLLSGIAISFISSAITRFIMTFDQEKMSRIITWTMGSFNSASWNKVFISFPFVAIGTVIMLIYSKDLNLISTGDETAKSLGVNVDVEKRIILAVSAVVTAACVAVSGVIGFAGLLVPHIVRILTGPDHRALLPFSAIWGAVFMLFCDTFARTIASPAEVPVGVITALFGAPFFVFLLIRSKRNVMGFGK